MDIKIIIEIIFVDKNLTNDRAQVLTGEEKRVSTKAISATSTSSSVQRLYLENSLPSFYWFYSNEEWDEMRTTTTTTTVRGERKKEHLKLKFLHVFSHRSSKSPLQNSIHAIIIILRRIFIWWRLLVKSQWNPIEPSFVLVSRSDGKP